MSRTRLLSLVPMVVTSLLLGGCGCDAAGGRATEASVVQVPTTAATLDVELGTGTDGFHALGAQQSVSMVHGPQGGQHVWVSLRIKDAGFDTARVNLSARYSENGAPAGEASGWIADLSVPMDGVRTHAGMKDYVSGVASPRVVILRAEVVAPDGRHGVDERAIMLTP